jgi:hypothetical protein
MTRPSPWLMTPALVAGTWLLAAQSPPSSAQLADLEKRVADLEARLGKAGDVTQVKAPFVVLGADGRPVLEVKSSPNTKSTGAVLIARHPGTGGGVYTMDEAGRAQAGMGVAQEGHGAVYVFNKAGNISAKINGTGAVAVWNEAGANVATLNTTSAGKGRLSIWDGDTRVALLEDSAGSGTLTLMKDAGGQVIARLGMVSGAGRLAVMGSEGGIGASLMGDHGGGGFLGLATRTGQTFAQAGLSGEGRGLFEVFAPGGASIAVMGQGGPGNAGIFQVANAGGVKANHDGGLRAAGECSSWYRPRDKSPSRPEPWPTEKAWYAWVPSGSAHRSSHPLPSCPPDMRIAWWDRSMRSDHREAREERSESAWRRAVSASASPSMRASSVTRSSPVDHRDVRGRQPTAGLLQNDQVPVRHRGDLRQVGDHQHLVPLGDLGQRLTHPGADLAADARVDLVEDQRRHSRHDDRARF